MISFNSSIATVENYGADFEYSHKKDSSNFRFLGSAAIFKVLSSGRNFGPRQFENPVVSWLWKWPSLGRCQATFDL